MNDKRTILLKRNIIASFVIKGWSVAMQFLLVPLTLHCLGTYENGLWLTISSMLLWIDNLDIGLGNGMRNKLAEYIAKDDIRNAQKVVSSTFFMLIILIVPLCVLINVIIGACDTYSFFNVNSHVVNNLDTILSLTTIMVCSTFIFKFIGNFYMGLQLPAINNFLVALGHTLTVIGVTVIYFCGGNSLLSIATIYTASPLLVYFSCFPITFFGKYSSLRPRTGCITHAMVKEMFYIGIKFFILQISSVVLFMSSNIIISQIFSPEMVTPYQIAYRYFNVALLIFSIICIPFWTATTDAFQRNDKCWILKSNATLNKVLLFTSFLIIILVIAAEPIYNIWLGNTVEIPTSMTIIMAIYTLIITISLRYSYVLNGFGALTLQLVMTLFAAILFIPLSFVVGITTKNINYLLLVMCIVNIPGLIVNVIQYHKIINGSASGIWQK